MTWLGALGVAACGCALAMGCSGDAGGAQDGSPPPGTDAGAHAGAGDGSPYGLDCPPTRPSSLPPESPRILVLGPMDQALPIAAYVQEMNHGDSADAAASSR